MHLKKLILLIMLFLCKPLYAQSTFYVGIAPSRTLFHTFGGYSIDPEVKYKQGKVVFTTIFGFSNYKGFGRKDIIKYSVKGFYYKIGIGYAFEDALSLELNYLQAFARERGSFYLRNSFGNYDLPFQRDKLTSKGLELVLNNWINLKSNFYLLLAPRITYVTAPEVNTYRSPPMELKLRYMTGVGAKLIATNDDKAWLSVGFEVKLLYKL